MTKALTEKFLALIPHEYCTTYTVLLVRDPNRRFKKTFQHFYNQFGVKDELERERNRDEMKTTWSLLEGFELLKIIFDNGIAFAAFADKPISPEHTLKMLLTVIARTGIFQIQYKEWHTLPAAKKPYQMHSFGGQ